MKCEYTEKVFEPNLLRIGWVTTSDEWMWVLGLVLVLLACGLAGRSAAGARGSGLPVGWAAAVVGDGWRVLVVLCGGWLVLVACIEPTDV